MEPAGLAVGIVALAGLFNNAVDCFEYVQLGRSFGTSFQISLLRLDTARLRLSRWGQAAGLSGGIDHARSLQDTALRAEELPEAERLLGQILQLFADAEGVSAKIKSQASPNDLSLVVLDAQKDIDSTSRSLHEKMRNLSIKRQNNTGLKQKAKWALYEEKHFRRLIEDLVELVNSLLDTFPVVQQMQKKLCEAEVSDIGSTEGLAVLKDIAASQDKDLEATIAKALKSRVGISLSQGAFFVN